MIIDRLREQLNLRVVVWNSVIYIDDSRPNKARPPTNHTTPEGPVQPCGPVRFSVADGRAVTYMGVRACLLMLYHYITPLADDLNAF